MKEKGETTDFKTDSEGPDKIEETMDDIMKSRLDASRLSLKIPPHNIEAEVAVLRIMFLDNRNIQKVKDIFSTDGDEFYKEANRQIFLTALKLFKQGQPVDLITLTIQLRKESELDRCGGTVYLEQIFLKEPPSIKKDGFSPDNLDTYINILREMALLRQLISRIATIADIAFQGNIKKLERFLKGLIKKARQALQFISFIE
jgi:replicative DNA helicase